MGSLILKLVKDTSEIARKTGLRSMDCNIKDISYEIVQAIKEDKADLLRELAKASADFEQNLIDKELNSHNINQSLEAPKFFSPIPTLTSPHKLSECMKLFPCRGINKFSGNLKDYSISIVEFLSNIKTAQAQCNLSVPEFKDMLLACTTGRAHILMLQWLDNPEESIDNIYHNLAIHFDRRITPEEAKVQLINFKASKNSTLAKIEAHLMTLCNRASTALPAGEARLAFYNLEFCNTLINCLPSQSNITVKTQYCILSAKLKRAATASELSKSLNVHRDAIDNDLKMHGSSSAGPRMSRTRPANNTETWSTASIYAMDYQTNDYGSEAGDFQRPDQDYTAQKQNVGHRSPQFPAQGNNKGRFRPGHKTKNSNFSPRQPQLSYCSLCGKTNHTSAQGCPFMVSDTGVQQQVHPVHGTCSLCPNFVQPRLNHPAVLCPYRTNGGPFSRKN